ncbi:MAG: transposase [Acidimicrobiaceae bacterium]|nr:transposase [Acidimicrobiaceae bacterium]
MADEDTADEGLELDWEAALGRWRAELDAPSWVTLAEAEEAGGVSRSALRAWYRNGEIPSRLEDGPHGPHRLVPLEAVLARAGRIRRRAAAGGSASPSPAGAAGDAGDAGSAALTKAMVTLLATQLERAELRAERAEAALRDALARAAAAEAALEAYRDRPPPRR